MQPGIVTTAEVQREMIADLERSKPLLLVRWIEPLRRVREPNGSGRSSGVTLLDDYLDRHYGGGESYGPYELRVRRIGGIRDPEVIFVRDCPA